MKNFKQKLLASLLSLSLLASILPVSALALETDSAAGSSISSSEGENPITDETNGQNQEPATGLSFSNSEQEASPAAQAQAAAVSITQEENSEEKVSVTLNGLHDMQINALKLYTYDPDSGTIGETDLLAGSELTNNAYTVELLPGHYWVDGYSLYEGNSYNNGGLSIEVSNTANTFKIQRMYRFSATFVGISTAPVQGTDYTVNVELTDAGGKKIRDVKMGSQKDSTGESVSCIFITGDTVKATFTAAGELAQTYEKPAVVSVKKTSNSYVSGTLRAAHKITVTAPAGSTVTAGKFSRYYTYDFSTPIEGSEKTDEAAGTITADYYVENAHGYLYGDSEYHFVRVQHPDGITYWKFGLWNGTGDQVTVTKDEVKIGQNYDKNKVVRDFSDNRYDTGNIYLSVNAAGSLYLRSSGMASMTTKTVNVWRNWQAKDTYWPTMVALPDVHYTILNAETGEEYAEGEAPITITETENNSSQISITGKKNGKAIVLVTYDAVTHPNAMARKGTEEVTFSAIWPENTGVIMVDIGGSNASLANMTLPYLKQGEEGKTQALDSELDVIYYTAEEGASYTFELKNENYTVSVARSEIVNGKMTFSGFDASTGIEKNGTSVTVSGLTEGRHIIRVTNGTQNQYQVITTKKAGYTVTHSDGSEVTAANPAVPNETVTIQYTGLYNPMEHLAGIYNNAPGVYLRGDDNSYFDNDVSMLGGYYDFSANSSRQKLTVTIPSDNTKDSYTLEGCLHLTGFGDHKGGHRSHSYNPTSSGGGNSPNSDEYLCYLPVVSIPTTPAAQIDVKLVFKTADGTEFTKNQLTTISIKNRNQREIGDMLAEDGTLSCAAGTYTYDISGTGIKRATGSFTVTESGTVNIELTASSANAWDGFTQTEPSKDNGVYQIGTGSEMAWFVEQSQSLKSGSSISGKLTADIDLAEYAWVSKWTTSAEETAGAIILDGNNHRVYGLNSNCGLFANLGNNSRVSNLTVQGIIEENSTTNGYAGSIASAVYGTTIENCVNEVTIQTTRHSAGGIVGFVRGSGYGSKITGCINKGTVSGAAHSGGIVGTIGSGLSNSGTAQYIIENCYNTAVINGKTSSGGIVGNISGTDANHVAVVKYCYTTQGKVLGPTATSKFYEVSDCACLSDTASDDADVIALTSEELKGFAPAGSDFVLPCSGGYPAVKWEVESGKYHTPEGQGSVTEPTCTAKGYTAFTCQHCGEGYKTDYVNALGHEASSTVASEYPAYTLNRCQRYENCQTLVKVWRNPAFEYMTLPDSGLSDLNCVGTWSYNTGTKRFEGGSNATSNQTSTFTFTVEKAATLEFTYGYSKYWLGSDTLDFNLSKSGETEALLNETLSKTDEKFFKQALDAGTYTLTFTYTCKSTSKNTGYGYFKDLTITCFDSKDDADQSMADYDAAKPVIDLIDAIGTVTLDSKSKITAARAAYDALTAAQKKLVTNYSTLTSAENTLAALEKADTEKDDDSITVTFRLIGSTICEDEDGVDLSIGLEGFHGVQYQTWIKTTSYTLSKGSTAYDLFEQALADAGLTYEGSKNWISGISAPEVLGGYMLRERENGGNSGWMYTVNGSHVNKTLDKYELKKNDKIIVHYINDYAYEQEDWATGSDGSSETWNLWLKAADRTPGESDRIDSGNTGSTDANTSTSIKPSAAADKNGEATANVSSSTMKDAIADAKDNESAAIVIEPEISGNASKITVNIPVSSAASAGLDANVDLTVKTETATVTIPAEELKNLSGSGSLTVSIENRGDGTVNISISNSGKSAELKDVSVTVPTGSGKSNSVLILVHEDGTEEILKKSAVDERGVTALVTGNATIKVAEKKISFSDTENHWAKETIAFVAAREIFDGTGSNKFSPDMSMSRAMLATVLCRLENSPATSGKANYTDKIDSWAINGVAWATEKGIVNGYDNNIFGGSRAITRQELATMLYRYAKVIGLNTDGKADLSKFTDSQDIADWARDAMAWAVSCGLFEGRTDSLLVPNGFATRAEVAVVIQRLIGMMLA